jgi:hypothetical protein
MPNIRQPMTAVPVTSGAAMPRPQERTGRDRGRCPDDEGDGAGGAMELLGCGHARETTASSRRLDQERGGRNPTDVVSHDLRRGPMVATPDNADEGGHMYKFHRRVAVSALGAAAALALATPLAQAGPIADNADCTAQHGLTQPFAPWLDLANYALSPDGGMEAGAAGWSLSGGATTTAGNERFFVGGASDSRSLSLPAGSSAVSAPICVGLEWPTIRFFTRSSGTGRSPRWASTSCSRTPSPARRGRCGSVRPSPRSRWQPTAQMVMVVNTLGALSADGKVPVSFRFTPVGAGDWQIDDLYVDPWRGP